MAPLLQYPIKTFEILSGILAFCVLYLTGRIIYNLCFHPLSRFPGPKSWAASRLPYIRHIQAGTLAREIRVLHCKYGDVVRVAPDELSFAAPEALQDIYTKTASHPAFPKGPFWNGTIKGQPFMVLNALDPSDHARMRKDVASAFTEKAVRAQEGLIEQYATKLVSCLEQLNPKKAQYWISRVGLILQPLTVLGILPSANRSTALRAMNFILGPLRSWRLSRLSLVLPRYAID